MENLFIQTHTKVTLTATVALCVGRENMCAYI